jgi:KamA family protein
VFLKIEKIMEERYKVYNSFNYKSIAGINQLSKEQLFDIEVVSRILPFKTNNYVVNNLIDWGNVENDPMFILNFPQRKMLAEEHYRLIADALIKNENKEDVNIIANAIRKELNPHPAGQLDHNIPEYCGERLTGIQHKYAETVLFFPTQGQTCHAYCTFCFRWPQFTGMSEFRFAMKQSELLIDYLRRNKSITDILITGGDPMVMSTSRLSKYIDAILDADIPHLKNIRIGTKSLSFWPYRYTTDKDADDILRLFEKVNRSGKHLALMAHVSHPVELSTEVVKKAISRIRNTGTQIRTQSPVINHINAEPNIWAEMWKEQVALGLIPYYMFIARNTGAQRFFAVPLNKAWHIFRDAYRKVSGVCRTVRGPSMSANPGKIQILGVAEVKGERVFALNFLQGRNDNWVGRPFFAKYNENAIWLDDLKPAFGESEFFFTKEFQKIVKTDMVTPSDFSPLIAD